MVIFSLKTFPSIAGNWLVRLAQLYVWQKFFSHKFSSVLWAVFTASLLNVEDANALVFLTKLFVWLPEPA